MLAFFIIPSRLFFLATASPFDKLLSNLKFPILHCETGSRDYIRMHARPTSTNKALASYRNVLSLNGSMSSVTKVYLSANGHCERRSRTSQVVASSQASSGLLGSLLDTQALNLGSPQALIRNAPNVSIARPSQITSSFLKRFFVTLISLGRMSGTWMRRVVSEEEEGRPQLKSTSCREINDHAIANEAGIWSLLQSLSVSMHQEIPLNRGSCSLESSFTEDGWKLIPKSSKSKHNC